MAKAAVGTVVVVGATVAEVVSVGGPNVGVDMIDVTALDTSPTWKAYIPGLKDGGQVTLECNLTTANATAMWAKIGAASASACTITLAGSSGVIGFNAHVSGISVNAPVADKISMTVTLQVTGAVSYT